jgi:hypothetical protein
MQEARPIYILNVFDKTILQYNQRENNVEVLGGFPIN